VSFSSSSSLTTTMMNTMLRRLPVKQVIRHLTTGQPDKVEYVHPLSQLVLEYLQTERSDWILENGLDQGLQVEKDGTFLIKFPSYEKDNSRIW